MSDILNKEGVIRFLKTDDSITRKIIDQLDQELKELGSNGLGWFKIENKDISGPLSKLISESEKEFLISQGNGVFLFQAGQEMEIAPFLDHIRRYIFKPTTEEQFTFAGLIISHTLKSKMVIYNHLIIHLQLQQMKTILLIIQSFRQLYITI